MRNVTANGALCLFCFALYADFTGFSPVCDSYVRPETLVRICDECNFGTYGGRCIICGSPGKLDLSSTFFEDLLTLKESPTRITVPSVHDLKRIVMAVPRLLILALAGLTFSMSGVA